MSGPERAGVLIYAKNLDAMSAFYEAVLGAAVVHADAEHRVLQTPDAQLLLHAIPAPYAEAVVIAQPPEPREQQAIKPFFSVSNLEDALQTVQRCGGLAYGPVWPGPRMRVRNVCDPEGNILHLREWLG